MRAMARNEDGDADHEVERRRDLADGETATVKGSAAQPYILKNTGGVYSCSCPAWRNQSSAIERRTCKHLRGLRGDAAEDARVGATTTVARARSASTGRVAPPSQST